MRREVLICFGLAAITLALFWPLSHHDFINLDDPDYVTQNPVVQAGLTGPGLHWAFGPSHANNWHPLTWISHMLDCQLFGLKPGAHHLVALGFHLASTVLLFLVLSQMTAAVWRSAFVAALFAWHPLHVESVAWVAERKDVLSAFFFMLTLWAYAKYVTSDGWRVARGEKRSPKSEVRSAKNPRPAQGPSAILHSRSASFYALALIFCALGLMSKPMLVTLPLVLLLLDYWPLDRTAPKTPDSKRTTLTPLLLEKIPFLALALAAGLLTLRAQHAGGAIASFEQLPAASRLANAPWACCAYLAKTFWPAGLCVFYPFVPVSAWKAALCAGLLLAATVICLAQRVRRPYLLVGWGWFCVMLLPVIGLVQVGWQALADRYTYLPLIGVFLMLAWAVGELAIRSPAWRIACSCGGALLLGACCVATSAQLKSWQDSLTLFSRAIEVNKDNWLAHNNLGTVLAEQGNLEQAAEHFRTALRINPAYDDARNNLGRYLALRGQWAQAEALLQELVQRNPRHVRAHRNLGHVLLAEGKVADGLAQYALARQLRPEDPETAADLATTLIGQTPMAALEPQVSAALDLLPTAQLRAGVAAAWAAHGDYADAVQAYRAALVLQPDSPEILNNLAWLLATCPEANLRDGAEAMHLAERACALTRFQRALMVGTLAAACAEAGRFAEAVSTGEKAWTLAAQSGDEALARKNQQLLQLYREGQPFHDPGAGTN